VFYILWGEDPMLYGSIEQNKMNEWMNNSIAAMQIHEAYVRPAVPALGFWNHVEWEIMKNVQLFEGHAIVDWNNAMAAMEKLSLLFIFIQITN